MSNEYLQEQRAFFRVYRETWDTDQSTETVYAVEITCPDNQRKQRIATADTRAAAIAAAETICKLNGWQLAAEKGAAK